MKFVNFQIYVVFLKEKEEKPDSVFSILNSYTSVTLAGWSWSTKREKGSPEQ